MSTPLSVAAPAPSSQPRFLEVDDRVPAPLRKLLDEADGCLDMSFTTGGTACW